MKSLLQEFVLLLQCHLVGREIHSRRTRHVLRLRQLIFTLDLVLVRHFISIFPELEAIIVEEVVAAFLVGKIF